jgi:hypothetical protein
MVWSICSCYNTERGEREDERTREREDERTREREKERKREREKERKREREKERKREREKERKREREKERKREREKEREHKSFNEGIVTTVIYSSYSQLKQPVTGPPVIRVLSGCSLTTFEK